MLLSAIKSAQLQSRNIMETIAKLPKPREGLPEQYKKCKNKIDDVRRRNLTIFGRVANLREQLTSKQFEGR